MTSHSGWTRAHALFLLCVAMAGVSSAQVFTNLASFDGGRGANPDSALVQGTDGNLYGTASGGGNQGSGTIFRVAPGSTLATLYSFCAQPNCTDGAGPAAGLVLAADGNFYGTTTVGDVRGYCDFPGCGTVFKMTSRGKLTTLHGFEGYHGDFPFAGLVQATAGGFFGTTLYGGGGFGNVFKITAAGVVTSLYRFCVDRNCPDGAIPYAGLVQATDGDFYGTTISGGRSDCFPPDGCGTVFKITSGGELTTLHSFTVPDGIVPSGLVQASDGNFYGTTFAARPTILGRPS
ncbi:MAG: hypothetical protein LAO09_08635 [Acidobacteriia bacterium]|nr:hypothetical protein [Terriglobia bacterium]